MASFDLNSHLSPIYATFPEAKRKPIIGITANFWEGEATMAKAYYQQVVEAGGTPVLIPPVDDKDVILGDASMGFQGVDPYGFLPGLPDSQPFPQDSHEQVSVPGQVYFAVSTAGGTQSYHESIPAQPSRLAYKMAVADMVCERIFQLLKLHTEDRTG